MRPTTFFEVALGGIVLKHYGSCQNLVYNLTQVHKSTKNWLSNFGLIEEIRDLAHILLDVCDQPSKWIITWTIKQPGKL